MDDTTTDTIVTHGALAEYAIVLAVIVIGIVAVIVLMHGATGGDVATLLRTAR